MTSFPITSAVFAAYKLLPPQLRYALKNVLKVNGHGTSVVDKMKAKRDAEGKKRLDQAMRTLASHLAHADERFTIGPRALEIGSGYVPSSGLCLFILGAEEVVLSDYNAIAQFDMLHHALNTSADADILCAAKDVDRHGLAEERLKKLRSTFDGTEGSLETLGIRYRAPLDLIAGALDAKFDFIYSICVLEHIPEPYLFPILQNLNDHLTPSGTMIHDIHLRDHRDMDRSPFEFLTRNSDYDEQNDVDKRGNRIRRGEWLRLFSGLPNSITRVLSQEIQLDFVPESSLLLPRFARMDPEERFVSRIVLATIRD